MFILPVASRPGQQNWPGDPGMAAHPSALTTYHSPLTPRSRGVAQTTCSSGRRQPQEAGPRACCQTRTCAAADLQGPPVASRPGQQSCPGHPRFAEGIRQPCTRGRNCRVVQLCNSTPASPAGARGTCLGSGAQIPRGSKGRGGATSSLSELAAANGDRHECLSHQQNPCSRLGENLSSGEGLLVRARGWPFFCLTSRPGVG